jgi:hypothetical protein
LAPSSGGSSSGRGQLGVARWCTWAVVFNGSSAQRRHGMALRWVFDGGSIGCGDDDLCREYGMVRHNGYGEHTRHGELRWRPAWRSAAVLTEGTAATASDRSGWNASAFKGTWHRAIGRRTMCPAVSDKWARAEETTTDRWSRLYFVISKIFNHLNFEI